MQAVSGGLLDPGINQLPAGVEVELAKDAADLALDGVHTDVQDLGNLAVAAAGSDQHGHPPLARGQRIERGRAAKGFAHRQPRFQECFVPGTQLAKLELGPLQMALEIHQDRLDRL